MLANPYQIYKQQDIATSNPREIVGKLYSTAAVSLKRAVLDIRNNRIEGANNSILKAETIIHELDACLDDRYELSAQLHQLYGYMIRRMIQANAKKDLEILNEISGMILEIRDAWEEAQKNLVKVK